MNDHTDKPDHRTDDPWESEMSSAFDRRVRDLHEAPLTLESVKGKAVGIRRRRRAVAAGSMLAAAAVIVPVAVAAANGLGDAGTGEAPLATSTPSATDSATPEAPTDPGALGIGYLEERTYHRADGTAVTLPRVYQTAAAAGDVVLAGGYDEQAQTYVVDVVDATGTVTDSFETRSLPVSDRAEDVVAYVDAAGDLRTVWDGGEAVLTSGLSENTAVTAVTGGPTCEPGSGCEVWIEDQSVENGSQVVTADGAVDAVPDDVLGVSDVNDDGLGAVTKSVADDLTSCGGVYDFGAQEYLIESCDYSYLGVSPDGGHADVALDYFDGMGSPWAAIVDRDGTEVARHTPEDGVVTDQAWQDDEHLLLVVHTYGAQEWSVVRLGIDGSEEVVAGPADGNSDANLFKLGG